MQTTSYGSGFAPQPITFNIPGGLPLTAGAQYVLFFTTSRDANAGITAYGFVGYTGSTDTSRRRKELLTSCLPPEGSLSNQSKETARAQIPDTVRERLQLSRYSETHAGEKPCGSPNVCRQRVEAS